MTWGGGRDEDDRMSEATGKSDNKKVIGCVIAAVVVGVLGLIGLGVGGYFFYLKMGEQAKGKEKAQTASDSRERTVPAGISGTGEGWQRREFLNVGLDAPFDLVKGDDVMAALPENVRALVLSMEMVQNTERSNDMLIQVLRSTYKPGIPMSLDGAIQGAMRSAANSMGDADPKFTVSSLKVSNLEARKATYEGTLLGRTTHVEIIAVQRENTLWQVQGLSATPAGNTVVKRILDSLEIVP